MTLKLEINGSFFEPEDSREEYARMLCELADKLVTGDRYAATLLRDINGKPCGYFEFV